MAKRKSVARHARRYRDLGRLQRQIETERRAALADFRADIRNGGFPAESETARMPADALEEFLDGSSQHKANGHCARAGAGTAIACVQGDITTRAIPPATSRDQAKRLARRPSLRNKTASNTETGIETWRREATAAMSAPL